MGEVSLAAKRRDISTKGAINKLRRERIVPGIFYSKEQKPFPIYTDEIKINSLVFTSEAHLINLELENEEPFKCVLKDVQFDPVTDRIIHFDLYGITVGQILEIQIPVVLKGQAIGVREGGILQHSIHKLDVQCLPKDIPEHLQIDIAELKIGDSVHVNDLSFENVKILNPEGSIVVSVIAPRLVEEAPVADEIIEEPVEPEVIGKGKIEEEDKE